MDPRGGNTRSPTNGEPAAFRALGFELHHTPGVARAWRRGLGCGYVLVTNADGFELPEVCGPYVAFRFAGDDRPLEQHAFPTFQQLGRWVSGLELRLQPPPAGGDGAQTFLPL